ncbi:MAG: hypothetical protein LKJ03_10905 [Enterococcaceae bacterium]|jgi:hypothetical protein|nr:hypothetical protein [Enterococcaceae bacterium]MCI1920115.1 hypothetical protein [Enterococcaceae bacterium]
MDLFLEGPSFVGKTSLLLRAVSGYPLRGLFVERRWRADQVDSFWLCDARFLTDASAPKAPLMETDANFHRTWHPEIFSSFGVRILDDALQAAADEVILLDEIGGIELLTDVFFEKLLIVLQMKNKIVGVHKSDQNAAHQAKRLDIPSEYFKRRKMLREAIEKNGTILTMEKQNQLEIEQKLQRFLFF